MRERERERIKEREIIVDSCIVHNERVCMRSCVRQWERLMKRIVFIPWYIPIYLYIILPNKRASFASLNLELKYFIYPWCINRFFFIKIKK